MRAGASSVSTRTALWRQRPRPARNVSSACSAGESSGPRRRRDAALGVPARRREQRALRERATSASAAAHSAA